MALKTNDPLALRLLMTDDLYIINALSQQTHPEIETKAAALPVFNYAGENNKFILILVNDETSDTINKDDLETLTSILTAKKLELRDVAIVNLHKHPSGNFEELKRFFSCSSLVLFGINPAQIALKDISSNQITRHEGTKILATYNFSEMRNDVTKKRLFWNEIKLL